MQDRSKKIKQKRGKTRNPDRFKKDEILMSAFSYGGLSKVANVEDLPSATVATDIIAYNGIGDFSAIELEKYLSGKTVNVSPAINSYSEGFSGYSSVKANVGSVRNEGFEVNINSDNIRTKNFSWRTSLNFAYNKNKIVDLILCMS